MKKDLVKNWEAFKKFRAEKREENLKSADYHEAQDELREVMETMPKESNIFNIWAWDMHEMLWNLAIMKRRHAENAGIPAETMEGMLDWLSENSRGINLPRKKQRRGKI